QTTAAPRRARLGRCCGSPSACSSDGSAANAATVLLVAWLRSRASDRASPASDVRAQGGGEAATGFSTQAERHVVVAQLAAVFGVAATILLPHSLRLWAAVAIAVP
ncbi:MAG: hypothetical protein QOG56_2339, partial [Solirubrobacteraceae bacterium]|nr:hypothetical protein [Solirubrobacteraceae bacterium]